MKACYGSVVLLGSLFCTSVHADLYLGLKAGTMLVGFDDVEVAENPVSVAASVGYGFDFLPGLSIEAEASRTTSVGIVENIELEVESQGVYLAYQTAGNLYLKGRVGYMDASLIAGELSEDEGGETFGLALGYRLPAFDIELDYTAVDDDVSFVSLGVRF